MVEEHQHPFTPLQPIALKQLPASSGDASRARAARFLESRIIASANFGDLGFDAGKLWDAASSRSQARFVHGLLFFVDWYRTVLSDEGTRVEAAASAWEIVETWAQRHADPQTSPAMAYHDETTAQRLINLISLYPFVRKNDPAHAEDLSSLMSSTADLLASDSFHSTGNNHGMFQDLALLYWAVLSDDSDAARRLEYFEKGMRRLKEYFAECFTEEGVHVENTPTYHLMVCRHVDNVRKLAQAANHADSQFYRNLISSAEQYATHALMPNGTYPPISDTQQNDIGRSGMDKVFTGEGFAFASTRGRRGRAPEQRSLVLPASGYAIYRSEWGNPDATFAFFSAAYNADYHKHSDDLSFFLRSGGIDLLCEAGPYSYDYSHPLSKHAYSQFAHNSLVVDGQSLPRTDGNKQQVTLRSLQESRDAFAVVGTNARYADVVHERTVHVEEGNGKPRFEITDEIRSSTEHTYQLLWNIGPGVSVSLKPQGFELIHNNEKMLDLSVNGTVDVHLTVENGRMKPRPAGWRFAKFGEAVPTNVVSVAFRAKDAVVHSKIKLDDFTFRDYELTRSGEDAISISVRARGQRLAYKLFREGTLVESKPYATSENMTFTGLSPGRYRVRVYVRANSSEDPVPFTTSWIRVD